MTIHKEGYPSILITVIFASLLLGSSYYFFSDLPWVIGLAWVVAMFFLIIILQFFRSPKRPPNLTEGAVLCPADGKVVVIEEVEEPEYFKDRRIQVSVFMSPLNVHINWLPMSGKIAYAKYHPGKYLVAYHPKSSTENERTSVVVESARHGAVLMRQVAGALARRIVYYVKQGDEGKQGDQMGFIKFGSRIDLYLPLDAKLKVELNQKVQGNTTIIAEMPEKA